MARVFLSTLGTGKYVPCHYVVEDWRSGLVVFVQEALLDYLCADWTEDDRITIFCTEEAKRLSWDDSGNFEEGLYSRLSRRNYRPTVNKVTIPSGRNENEIMEIFLKVVETLRDNDRVFVDVTHAFRSIPLLMMVALNYAKVVKDISVERIFYGAFEVLGSPAQVEKMPENERNAPVFDLTAYDSILEWARAVDVFRKAGYAEDLGRLINKNLGLLFRERGKEERKVAEKFSELKRGLEGLMKNLAAARGPEIWEFSSFMNVIDDLEGSELIPPMKPLFELLKRSLAGFEVDDPMERTFHAVEWCIDHSMVPQAYILLREGIITGLCERAGHDLDDEENREGFWGGVLHVVGKNVNPEQWDGVLSRRKQEALEIIRRGGDGLKGLAGAFDSLRRYRNDYLHGGWNQENRSAEQLLNNVKRHLGELRGKWYGYLEEVKNHPKRAFVLLSHDLTEAQREELHSVWGVSEIVPMPDELRKLWSDISPDEDSIEKDLVPVFEWLEASSCPGDVVFVQGEYGATFQVAIRARELGLVPIYSTTHRTLEERRLPDGSVLQERVFRHVRFRKFFP